MESEPACRADGVGYNALRAAALDPGEPTELTRALQLRAPPAPAARARCGLRPVVECVAPMADGGLQAVFGPDNPEAQPVTIPVGDDNVAANALLEEEQGEWPMAAAPRAGRPAEGPVEDEEGISVTQRPLLGKLKRRIVRAVVSYVRTVAETVNEGLTRAAGIFVGDRSVRLQLYSFNTDAAFLQEPITRVCGGLTRAPRSRCGG